MFFIIFTLNLALFIASGYKFYTGDTTNGLILGGVALVLFTMSSLWYVVYRRTRLMRKRRRFKLFKGFDCDCDVFDCDVFDCDVFDCDCGGPDCG